MAENKTLTFYLKPAFLRSVQAGKINFVNRTISAFESEGFECELVENSDLAVVQSASRTGYAMFHMEEPFHEKALTMRRAYVYPFWRIEKSAKRWEWDVATTEFKSSTVSSDDALKFSKNLENRLFGQEIEISDGQGYAYVPLQGRLLQHRSFQSMSPLDMVKAILRVDKKRRVVATLHPKERYLSTEIQELNELVQREARLTISPDDGETLVRNCDYVATQNSGAAFTGYIFQKPAMLFGKIDFHHIAANVESTGVEEALRIVEGPRPDFRRYIYWFLQLQSINAGREPVDQQILDRVRQHGWEI